MAEKLNGSCLFIVGSPFQCLCMIEAISFYGIENYDVFINTDEANYRMIQRLLSLKGLNYVRYNHKHLIYDVLPLIFKSHKLYDNVFIGNYYSIVDNDIACIYAKKKANIYYLDDGVQVLNIFSNKPRNQTTKLWVGCMQMLFKLILYIKRIREKIFFTIYDVSSDKFRIDKNPFKSLKTSILKPRGLYIISTNSSLMPFRDCSYFDILDKLLNKLIDRFPNEEIFFCPHRRDKNNPILEEFCVKKNINWFNTQISVEADLITNNNYPTYIVGFNSNALYTLHEIFPMSIVENIDSPFLDEKEELEAQLYRKKFQEYGIPLIKV